MTLACLRCVHALISIITKVVKDAEVPLAVKTPEGLTAPFNSTNGLKQGEPSSPDLFGLYIDDLAHEIESLGESGDFPKLNNRSVPPLLHADDMALVATSVCGLQEQLNNLQEYATKWDLQISLTKTKIITGEAGTSSSTPTFTVHGTELEWVEEFTYLGVPFHSNKPMDAAMAAERLLKARRAQAALRYRCSQLGIRVAALQSHLFDVIVRSTLSYGVELWGPGYLLETSAAEGNDAGEKLHREFLRRLLGAHKKLHNLITYAEFGRYPLRCGWYSSIYQYWRRLAAIAQAGERTTLAAAVKDNMALAAAQEADGTPAAQQAWCGKIAALVQKFGVNIELTAGPVVPPLFSSAIDGAARGEHLQAIKNDNGTRMATYKSTIRGWTSDNDVEASNYQMAPYLKVAMPVRRRLALSRLRTSCHSLRVEVERHQPVHPPREARTCRLCSAGAVEDEHHMMFDCGHAALVQLRDNYAELLGSGEQNVAAFLSLEPRAVASFVYECFQAGDYDNLERPARVVGARGRAAAATGTRRSPRLASQQS